MIGLFPPWTVSIIVDEGYGKTIWPDIKHSLQQLEKHETELTSPWDSDSQSIGCRGQLLYTKGVSELAI